MKRRTNKWLTRAGLLVGALAASLAVTELVLRWLIPINPYVLEIHEKYLHRRGPGSAMYLTMNEANGGRTTFVQFNRWGYRGEEIPDRSDRFRIVVYGDSFIEAEYSPVEATFVKQLEAALSAAGGRPVEVINAGTAGYGPDQEFLRLEDEIRSLSPDLVIVAICANNDFGDLLRNKLFRLAPDGSLSQNLFTISDWLRNRFDLRPPLPLPRGMLALYGRLDDRLNIHKVEEGPDPWTDYVGWAAQRCQLEYSEYVTQGDNEVKLLLEDHYDADVALHPLSVSATYKRQLMDLVIGRMQSIAIEERVRIVVLIIPSAIDACDGYDYQVDTTRWPDYRRSTLSDAVVKIVERRQLPYVNLFPTVRAADCNKLYFHAGNDHWNDDGQALAARLMAAFLKSRGLVGEAVHPSSGAPASR